MLNSKSSLYGLNEPDWLFTYQLLGQKQVTSALRFESVTYEIGAMCSGLCSSDSVTSITSGLGPLRSTVQMLCVRTDKCPSLFLWKHVWNPQLARPENEQVWTTHHHKDSRQRPVERTQAWGSEWVIVQAT